MNLINLILSLIFGWASEDHDFKEVNHVYLYGKKFVWESFQKRYCWRF